MGRYPRRVPPSCPLVEVTQKTIQGRLLLRPDRDFNDIFLGVLGRAQRLYPVEVMGVVCLSNHFHLLLHVSETVDLSAFMGYVNGNLAKEVNRLRGISGPVWASRYRDVPVTHEPEAQIGRLRYLLSHGVKEHLVKRCRRWPGVHVAKHLIDREELAGWWFDRTREFAAVARGKRPGKYEHAERETVEISPLPCMAHLPTEEYRAWIKGLVHEIDTTYEAAREREGRNVLGVNRILRADPFEMPEQEPRSKRPIPRVHAASKAVRKAFYEAFSWFLAAYREAAKRLRAGEAGTDFPKGCFPPALPYVPYRELAPRPP